MIKKSIPLTIAEVANLAGDTDREKEVKNFIKKFTKMSAKKAEEMKKELEKLDLIKLKPRDIVKIIDFKPEDGAGLIKIIPEVSLEKDEINKILEIVKKY
jgi:DNA-directed RNA polymerase subunit F